MGGSRVLMPTRAMQGVFSWCSWSYPPAKGWQAFNDSASKNGGTEATSPPSILGEPIGPTEDVLLQLESGASTKVARYEETFSTEVFWTSIPSPSIPRAMRQPRWSGAGSEEHQLWRCTWLARGFDPEGLDSGRSYTFAGTR